MCFSFSPSICYLQNLKTKEVLAAGKVLGALYILDLSSFHHIPTSLEKTNMPNASSFCNACTSLNKSDHQVLLWHISFGHASISTSKHLPFLSNNVFHDLHTCEICPLAKQPRLSFSPNSIHTHSIFELIHVDL